VVVMRQARVEQVGPPQEIFDHPRTPFVYEFLGNVNKIPHANGEVRYVRPHEMEITFAAEYDAARDVLADVTHLFSAGPVASLSLRLGDGSLVEAEISRKQLEELALSVGDRVAVRWP
jgi:sulfate transport system ATP-binding protein